MLLSGRVSRSIFPLFVVRECQFCLLVLVLLKRLANVEVYDVFTSLPSLPPNYTFDHLREASFASANATAHTREVPNYSWTCYRYASKHHQQPFRYRGDIAGMKGRLPCWIPQPF